jgi:sigma-B regulation protein RsbU (phosphoserine phosphatase)
VNTALAIYASGFEALQRDDFDPEVLGRLDNPTPEMRGFGEAFHRLSRHIVQKRRNRGEMASAALIQRAMLPHDLAGLDPAGRCDVFGEMISARDVGGDLYDVFRLDDDRLALAVGDVCGKGVPASLFMSVTMTVLRLAAQGAGDNQAGERVGGDVTAALLRANAMLHARNPSALFVTLFYGVLDLRTGQLDYASCGHNPAFVLSAGGACRALAGGGTPLGLFQDKIVRARRVDLAAGDTLVLYTDGMTECANRDGEEFGETRLAETLAPLAGMNCEAVCRSVIAAVADFTRGVDPFDDMTCLAARWSPA